MIDNRQTDHPSTVPLLIYIAGPYRGKTSWQVDENIQNARRWGVAVARAGAEHGGAYPVIPHSNTAHFDGEASDKLWLDGTLELMRRCDGVLLTGAWRNSVGASAEFEAALKWRIPTLSPEGFCPPEEIPTELAMWLDRVRNGMAIR